MHRLRAVRHSAVVLFCSSLTVCGHAAGDESRLLRFHRGQGDVASYDVAMSGRGVREGRRVEFSEKVKCQVEFQGEADGTQQLQARYLAGTFNAASEGEHKSGSVMPMVMKIRITPTGQTVSTEVVSGENTTVPFAEMSSSPQDADFVLDLPTEPVKKGSTWKAEQKNPEEGRLPAVVSVTYTLLGYEAVKGRPCARIKAVSLTEFTDDQEASGTGPAIHIEASWGETTVFLFDYERGLVMSADSTQRVSFITTIRDATAGQPVEKDSFVLDSKSVLTGFAPHRPGSHSAENGGAEE